MISIDSYAYTSKLSNSNPSEKLIFAILSMFVCIYSNSPYVPILILFIMSFAAIIKGGISPSLFFKFMCIPFSFLIIALLTIAIITLDGSSVPIFSIKFFNLYIGSTRDSLNQAFIMLFKSLGAISCLYFLSLSTPMTYIILALKKFKVPKLFAELMTLVYKFIFVLLDTASKIFLAQNSRLGYNSFRLSMKSLALLSSNLFIKSYKRSQDTYTALEARGYEGDLDVVSREDFSTFLSMKKILLVEILLFLAAHFI